MKNKEKREKMIDELIENHGWVDIGSLRGLVKVDEDSDSPPLEYGAFDLRTLEPGQEFRKLFTTRINKEENKEIKKIFLLIVGPELIYFTDHFLEKIFSELSFEIRFGANRRMFHIVKEEKVNKHDLLLMGEILEWMIYFLKKWDPVQLNVDDIELEFSGKTGSPPKNMEFGIGAFMKVG